MKLADAPPTPAVGEPPQRRERHHRLELVAFALLAYVPFLVSSPGRVTADTKQYLYLDPDRLLSRAAYLWDSHIGFGTVSHQIIGYLFPMGPFFWLTDHVGMPEWVAQRLWLGSISLAAALGARWLFRMLGVARGGAIAGALPTCEELLACAPPDRASWHRVTTALLADDAADRVLRHSGVCVVSDVLDDLVDDLQAREDPPLDLRAFVDEQREEVSRAHAFAWLAAHRRAYEVTERRLGRLGHRARDLESLRHGVGLTLHEAAFPTSLELLAHLSVFVDDALGVE